MFFCSLLPITKTPNGTQDRAKSALESAHQAYGMSATDLALQTSSRSRSRRGRGRFSAVANGDGMDTSGPSPRNADGDLICFGDLGDSDAQRLRSVFPAPASSVGSAVSCKPIYRFRGNVFA